MSANEPKTDSQEEQSAGADPQALPTYDISKLNFKNYANDSIAIVTDAEVIMAFGDGTVDENDHLNIVTQVAMPHTKFMGFVEYLMTRYTYLLEIYGTKLPAISDMERLDPQRVAEARARFNRLPSPSNVTGDKNADEQAKTG